eukprot:comp12450_c0_seq1/m.7379 comp12450_c0_seq1/g.7379  ORF comp12450_c0_seq1/g.7379 comp12450_c0_seq1/m.7379 type:complete len:179 (-) comp12450_c0_seq1:338-874(-)
MSSLLCLRKPLPALWKTNFVRNFCTKSPSQGFDPKDFAVGVFVETKRTFSPEEVKLFSELSGDNNPVHVNEEYAKTTRFGRCIVHGALMNSVISALLGTRLPGPGSIYISQTVRFKRPLYVGEEMTARVRCLKIGVDKPIAHFSTECFNDRNEVCMEGEAVVGLPKEFVRAGRRGLKE